MSISALASGAYAMHSATTKFDASAARIARAGTDGGNVDLAGEVVNILGAQRDFELATKVVKVATDMEKHAIDILA